MFSIPIKSGDCHSPLPKHNLRGGPGCGNPTDGQMNLAERLGVVPLRFIAKHTWGVLCSWTVSDNADGPRENS